MHHLAVDTGPDFEARALAVARARHDPMGSQGAVMFEGAEHDGIFISSDSINVYEFTTERKKEKAAKDGAKIARILKHLERQPENRARSLAGYFVTRDEPTAEQRGVIAEISRREGVSIRTLSFLFLQRNLVDVDQYIRLRENAPFGSADTRVLEEDGKVRRDYIEPSISGQVAEKHTLENLANLVLSGNRIALVGDYGIGKSAAFRELFFRLRKRYFKKPDENHFPIHINVRDCIGLKTPNEILRRHAEDLGFGGSDGLVAAWRAGRVHLLLDGFDELVPTRWVGSVRHLRDVRWEALAPVRRLIEETPEACGIAVSGRLQYFNNQDELAKCLSITQELIFRLDDFDAPRAEEMAGGIALPSWLPTRPLAIMFYVQQLVTAGGHGLASEPDGWLSLLRMVADREAERIASISSETFVALLGRLATLARGESGEGTTVSLTAMRRAFVDVCGYEAEEEGIQALLRLPGLATSGTSSAVEEGRSFVDRDLADAAYAVDLCSYIQDPHSEVHPLRDDSPWSSCSGTRVGEICATELRSHGFDAGVVRAPIKIRVDRGQNDAILADLLFVADALGEAKKTQLVALSEVIIDRLPVSPRSPNVADTSWSGCLIEVLDVAEFEPGSKFPHFSNSLIETVDGWAETPTALASNFSNSPVSTFVSSADTTAEILSLALSKEQKIALTILKKVYRQAGSARKLSALNRGLPPELRPAVRDVLDRLVTAGLVSVVDGKGDKLVTGVSVRRGEALSILDAPRSIRNSIS